jgi:hypothetical protein
MAESRFVRKDRTTEISDRTNANMLIHNFTFSGSIFFYLTLELSRERDTSEGSWMNCLVRRFVHIFSDSI